MGRNVSINRLATGAPGLDAILGGGLPEFSSNLISGPPGTGKTTLAHQLMFALATRERRALYFTVLSEPVREYEDLLSGRPMRTPAAPLGPGPGP